jgi:hypothetical protein
MIEFFHPLLLCIVGAFWIFGFWVIWMIVKALRGIDDSLKAIARNLPEKN